MKFHHITWREPQRAKLLINHISQSVMNIQFHGNGNRCLCSKYVGYATQYHIGLFEWITLYSLITITRQSDGVRSSISWELRQMLFFAGRGHKHDVWRLWNYNLKVFKISFVQYKYCQNRSLVSTNRKRIVGPIFFETMETLRWPGKITAWKS